MRENSLSAEQFTTPAERNDRFGCPVNEPPGLAALRHESAAAAARVRASAWDRARAYGPVTVSRGPATGDAWCLMATTPERVHPRWRALLGEAGSVFARAQAVQEAAETRLRRQWDRAPAARAARLLARQLGRAWTCDHVTAAELAACEQVLAGWHPAALIDHGRLRQQRDRIRAQRESVRRVLADLAGGQPRRVPAAAAHRRPHEVLQAVAADRLDILSRLAGAVPFPAWHEWEWTLDLIRQQSSAAYPQHLPEKEQGR